jgi:acid phosphatase
MPRNFDPTKLYWMLLSLWLTALTVAKQAEADFPETVWPPSPFVAESPLYRGLDANLYMQTSAEYRAACYQAFNIATSRLDTIVAENDDPSSLAVIVDLDETLIDNAGFQSWMQRTGRAFDLQFFLRWEQFGGAETRLIPGAKAFVKHAESKGVTLFYISNRSDLHRKKTLATLRLLGIKPRKPEHVMLRKETSDKTARKDRVRQLGFQPVLNVGDNLRDFDERFKTPQLSADASGDEIDASIDFRKDQVDQTKQQFGSDWIILPNPAYGEWTKPLGRGRDDVQRLHRGATPMQFGFWNVENLFDLDDDPTVEGDEEFTADGPKNWNQQRLDTKLRNLARIVSRMNSGRGPDVLGLSEVENRKVVQMLVDRLEPLGRQYKIVHQDSPSDRGIDCALIYDSAQFDLAEAKYHFVDADNTRDILEATLSREGRTVTVFVNHWPSRGNPETQRFTAADVLRRRVDALLKIDPLADLVIMGDFNDHPEDPSLRSNLSAVLGLEDLDKGDLFNSSAADVLNQRTATYVYRDQWQILDQIILSPGMLLPGGVNWGIGSTRSVIFADDQLYDPRGPAPPRPSRSFTRNTFHSNGYSDHLPVLCDVYWAR